MNAVTCAESLGYVDQQLTGFRERTAECFAKANEIGVSVWNGQENAQDIFSSRQEPLDNYQGPFSPHRSPPTSPALDEWSDSSSDCSAASSLRSLLEHQAHNRSQFAKLLPRNDEENSIVEHQEKLSFLGSLRKSLRRKKPISDLKSAANIVCVADVAQKSPKSIKTQYYQNDEEMKSSSAVRASPQTRADHSQRNSNRGGLSEECARKRVVPQGRQLTEAKLTLQEKIVSRIADQAVQEAQRRGKDMKANRKSELAGIEETPEDLDRELEVTRAVMTELRKALNEGSYRDAHLVDGNREEENPDLKHAILHEILLMLRRSFQEILANFERAYRPTGFTVTDQEMAKEMDEQLLARRKLMHSYSMMSIEDMLDSLGSIGPEARLKKLAFCH